jgi:FtsZ-binding cell division protein ZapB
MSKELSKMTLISIVQQLPKEDIQYVQDYIENMEKEIEELKADYGNKAQVERDLLEQENEELKNKIDKAIEYIESNPKVYVYDDIIYVNDIIEWENSCAEINKTEFIKTLLKILKGSDE